MLSNVTFMQNIKSYIKATNIPLLKLGCIQSIIEQYQ